MLLCCDAPEMFCVHLHAFVLFLGELLLLIRLFAEIQKRNGQKTFCQNERDKSHTKREPAVTSLVNLEDLWAAVGFSNVQEGKHRASVSCVIWVKWKVSPIFFSCWINYDDLRELMFREMTRLNRPEILRCSNEQNLEWMFRFNTFFFFFSNSLTLPQKPGEEKARWIILNSIRHRGVKWSRWIARVSVMLAIMNIQHLLLTESSRNYILCI